MEWIQIAVGCALGCVFGGVSLLGLFSFSVRHICRDEIKEHEKDCQKTAVLEAQMSMVLNRQSEIGSDIKELKNHLMK